MMKYLKIILLSYFCNENCVRHPIFPVKILNMVRGNSSRVSLKLVHGISNMCLQSFGF